MSSFPEGYLSDLEKGYYTVVDGKKCMNPKFIVEYPRSIAEDLEDDSKNKLSQLRKFYDYARRIRDSLNRNDEVFDAQKAELSKLKPAVNYAYVRETVSDVFKDFIDVNVSRINDREDLDAFIEHFQALIAYLPRENQK